MGDELSGTTKYRERFVAMYYHCIRRLFSLISSLEGSTTLSGLLLIGASIVRENDGKPSHQTADDSGR
jgi:hypothetical protein